MKILSISLTATSVLSCFPLGLGRIVEESIAFENDYMGSPLIVKSDDVEIDCQGYTIGVNGAIPGGLGVINVANYQRVKIKNCVIDATPPQGRLPLLYGIRTEGANVELEDVTVMNAQLNGLDVNDNSYVLVSGVFTATSNELFGVFVQNGSNLKLLNGEMNLKNNVAGLQVGLSSTVYLDANSFPNKAILHADENQLFGFTVLSLSHLFTFGPAVVTANNNNNGRGGGNGFTVFSKSMVEIDRNGSFEAKFNGGIGVWVEDSSINMFTLPFSPDIPSMAISGNGRQGLLVTKEGSFDTNRASIVSIVDNFGVDVEADNGGIVSFTNTNLNSVVVGSVDLKFGSRGEILGTTPSSLTCDGTVLYRDDSGIGSPSCPAI